MDMIQEDGGPPDGGNIGPEADLGAQALQSKPFSAAHGARNKINKFNKIDMLSEPRGGASSKVSTQFTHGGFA